MKAAPKTWITDAYVAERFADFRRDLKVSQADMARLLNMPFRETVTEIEAGRRKLTAAELIALLVVTKRSLDDFLD